MLWGIVCSVVILVMILVVILVVLTFESGQMLMEPWDVQPCEGLESRYYLKKNWAQTSSSMMYKLQYNQRFHLTPT